MSKLLVDVDDELLAKAAHRLGTTTKKDTINTALAHVARSTSEDEDALHRFDEVADLVGERLGEVSRDEMWR